jgi:threonine/homoserine/homoserine lactone efflux protein
MQLAYLLRGIALGFSIAAPVGPIGVLCIRRTLTEGKASGLATGLGAASADALYGTATALGLSLISGALVDHSAGLRLLGGAFLCYLGLTTMAARPAYRSPSSASQGLLRSYLTGLFLTLANPMTIFSFAAILAGTGALDAERSSWAAALLVLGTFLGSAGWWLVLSTGVHVLRGRFNQRSLCWLNRASGFALLAFGLSSLASALPRYV